jgi:hypothetical protein
MCYFICVPAAINYSKKKKMVLAGYYYSNRLAAA